MRHRWSLWHQIKDINSCLHTLWTGKEMFKMQSTSNLNPFEIWNFEKDRVEKHDHLPLRQVKFVQFDWTSQRILLVLLLLVQFSLSWTIYFWGSRETNKQKTRQIESGFDSSKINGIWWIILIESHQYVTILVDQIVAESFVKLPFHPIHSVRYVS